MKISNFEFEKMDGRTALDKAYWASVEVETGALWWKKKERRRVRREFAGCWYFVDTGEFTPCYCVENLARAHKAQTGQET